jgi:hypothetical protein
MRDERAEVRRQKKERFMAGRNLDEDGVERAVTALLEDSGLPPWGPYRSTVKRRVRIALDAYNARQA